MSKGIVYEYEDGGTYCGEWETDSSHGYGCGTGPGGQGRYEGLWEHGGQVSGIYTWPNGMKYMGSWKNNKRDGLGKESREDGTEYSGEFIRGARGPYGVIRLPNGVYRGSWRNGKQDGEGEEVYLDGGCYRGQYKNGMRSGFGSRTSAAYEHRDKDCTKDGTSSSGGTNSGSGRLSTLVAPFGFKRTSFSVPTSHSTMSLSSQHSTSSLPMGIKKGGGTGSEDTSSELPAPTDDKVATMQIYEGEWREDKRHGYGVIKCIGLYTYYGQWVANTRTGYGVLVGDNGLKEEGQFQNGQLIVALKRKKLHLKSHQLETKVQTAHTQAIQAADTARNKALLAESRSATALSKAKMALGVVGTAEKNAQLAREKAEQYKNATRISEGVKSPMREINQEFPFSNSPTMSRYRAGSRVESKPGEESPSLSSSRLLDVRPLPHAPSYESLQYSPQSQDSDEEYASSVVSSLQSSPAEERRKLFSSAGSNTSSKMEDELQWKRNDFARYASVSERSLPGALSGVDSDLREDAQRRISEGGNRIRSYSRPQHPLHITERSLEEEEEEEGDGEPDEAGVWHREEKKGGGGVTWRKRRRRSIDKTTGEVKDHSDEDSPEDRPPRRLKPAPLKKKSSVAMDMLVKNLNQMANWNKMIAYVNFFLLVFLMMLILVVVISMNYYQLTSYYHDQSTDDQQPSTTFSPIA